MNSTALIVALLIQLVLVLGTAFVSMKYIAPAVTRKGFGFNRGFWPSIAVIALAIFGGGFLSNAAARLLIGVAPHTILYFQAYPVLMYVWEIFFSAVAIFLVARMMPALVFVKSFFTAVIVAAVNFAFSTVVMLLLGLALSGIMSVTGG
ncbi:MAG TPA: hypothetical protein PKD05_11315 [Candidatus Melainabacteria bacterium]|nr:hypothetical protein [Candidatus Melainabacteria bacterium]